MPATAKTPIDKVRQLQIRLWMCAKRSRTRRFHALYDRIYRSDVLWKAWTRVRSNKGAAGVDEVTAKEAMTLAAHKLPIPTKFVTRAGGM